MKRLFGPFLALALVLMFTGPAFAWGPGGDGTRYSQLPLVVNVYNNSGSALTSGAVVVWDTSATAGSTLGSYVTTTTTADNDLAAGVVFDDSIAASSSGRIVVWGPALVNYANGTDGTAVLSTACGTTTVAGQAGNAAADSATLGTVLETDAVATDYHRVWIFVDPSRIN